MSIWVEIRCNKCNRIYGEAEYYTRENIAKLKAGARAEGWTITYKGNVICNRCKTQNFSDTEQDGKND